MLSKYIEKEVLVPSFLIELTLNVTSVKDDLIKTIEKGILENSNMNYKTNVKGQMTHWKYFNSNQSFLSVLDQGFLEIEKNMKLKEGHIFDAWGIKIFDRGYTVYHNHSEALYSGILYLNDSEQVIHFPRLNIEINPKEGSFLFFSSHLIHGTKNYNFKNIKYAIPFNFKEKKTWD